MRILVVTGSSGGHIFPALSFLDALNYRCKDIDTILILPLSRRPLCQDIAQKGIVVNYISISPIRPIPDFKNFIAVLKFFKGLTESIRILLKFKPKIVVGFGTLVCIPMVVFAKIFGIKTLIHEQNVMPGRANRFLAKFADRIAVSFDETKIYLRGYQEKIVLTGNPIRKELEPIGKNRALDFFRLSNDKFTILVMGGSQGSRRINFGFLRAISAIAGKSRLQAIHLAGPSDYDLLQQGYKDALGADIRLFRFLESQSMQYAYSACDLVVSRGGASTIAEIISFGLPAIIIPYPFAYEHQMANARILEKMGSAIIIEDSRIHEDVLQKKIEDFLKDPQKIKAMGANYNNICRLNTDELLVQEALSLNN